MDGRYQHTVDALQQAPGVTVGAIFGPQHGFRSDVQDNMIETPHDRDGMRRVPIYSLYSDTREPAADMLLDIDVLVIDLLCGGEFCAGGGRIQGPESYKAPSVNIDEPRPASLIPPNTAYRPPIVRGPHPHGVPQAFAAFYLRDVGVLRGFSLRTGRVAWAVHE